MRRPVQILLAAGLAGLTTACAGGPQHVDGLAVPAGLVSPTAARTTPPPASPSVAPSSVPPSSASPSRSTRTATADLTIQPDRIGPLRIGMSLSAAEDTGLIVVRSGQEDTGPDACVSAYWKGRTEDDWMIFNGKYGLRALDSFGNQKTPEGIRTGSTLAAVLRAYPERTWRLEDSYETPEAERTTGEIMVDAVTGDGAHYRIKVKNSKVEYVQVESDRAGCYE
jgi:hypothetical protein